MSENKDELKWTTLSSEYLFNQPPWLTVRKDVVQLPDGRINPEFFILEYPSWINVIAITDDGMMVMERQYRHGIDETRYEICAGVVEPGEAPLLAAQRELEEETGYTGGEWSLMSVISGNPSVTNNLTYCYLAKGVKKTTSQHLDATEDIKVELLTQDQVLKLLVDDEIKQALMVGSLWKYFYQKLLAESK